MTTSKQFYRSRFVSCSSSSIDTNLNRSSGISQRDRFSKTKQSEQHHCSLPPARMKLRRIRGRPRRPANMVEKVQQTDLVLISQLQHRPPSESAATMERASARTAMSWTSTTASMMHLNSPNLCRRRTRLGSKNARASWKWTWSATRPNRLA